MTTPAADCGRLSFCYSRLALETELSLAADCGRLSFCYSWVERTH